MSPRQYVAYKRLCHQHDEDQHAEDPDELTRLFVGAVHECTHHVQVDHDKKRRGTGGMHVAQQPAVIHIAHDVFDRGESLFRRRCITHRQPDACQQLVDEHQQRKHTKEVPQIKVLGRVVLAHVRIPRPRQRQPRVNPGHQTGQCFFHQAASASTPITSTLSLS